MRKFVENRLGQFGSEISTLAASYGIKKRDGEKYDAFPAYTVDGIDKWICALKDKYVDGFDRTYIPDSEDELDDLNARVHCYEGDVTTAISELTDEHEALQEEVNDAAKNDEEAASFKEELDQIDWGKEEFDKLTVPDKKQVIRTVLNQLKKWLEELESQQKCSRGKPDE